MIRGVIDIGNTRIKTAVFNENGSLLEKAYFHTLVNAIEWLNARHVQSLMAASVAQAILPQIHGIKTYSLTYQSRMPFDNDYQSKETLGVDRIAAMAAAAIEFPGSAVIVFDIGTCMTIDVLHPNGTYKGGNISPGIEMRLKAMHNYTQRLPLANKEDANEMLGNSTVSALANGVINGMQFEIDGYINHYLSMYPNLKIVLCGGDYSYFDKQHKYEIFAAPDFVLKGLYHLLILNED